MKKTFLTILLGLLFLFLASNLVQAADADWCSDLSVGERSGGIVPCGRPCNDPTTPEDETDPCTLCHFFAMLDRIIDYLLRYMVPTVAVLMIAIGGFMYIVAYAGSSGGGPEMLSRARKLFAAVGIGLLIIYGAFLIIGVFLSFMGLAEWTTDIYGDWMRGDFFEIRCD